MPDFSIESMAEDALLLRFGDGIDIATNARVHAAANALREARINSVTDIAPAYASLLVRFDPFAWRERDALCAALTAALQSSSAGSNAARARAAAIEIPVCYGGDFGPDLDVIATHTGLSPDEVISRHAAGNYSVAMLGFAPGFPYLLGLDATLHVPRRANPRVRVPPGSVAIGGAQTGIYPKELPGGWQLIGRTPLRLFDAQRAQPALLAPGDRVRFRPIDAEAFAALAARAT